MGAFYTYELIDPRDGTVFYIGKGNGSRRYAHEKEARAGKSGAKCDRIRDIISEGRSPQARIVAHYECEQEAYRAEAKLIAEFVGELTNICAGGRGGIRRVTQEQSARHLVNQCYKQMRQAIQAHRAGMSIPFGGANLLQFAYDLAMRTRDRAGAEYFDQRVGC